VSFVASQAEAHAMKPPAPQAPRPLPAADRASPPPFESLLGDDAQTAAPPAPNAPPARSEPPGKRAGAKAADSAPPSKLARHDQAETRGKAADNDETAKKGDKKKAASAESAGDRKAVCGKADGKKADAAGDPISAKSDKSDTKTDGKPAADAATPSAAAAQTAPDKTAAIAAAVAAPAQTAETAAPPAKDAAVIGAAKPAQASAAEVAAADDTAQQAAPPTQAAAADAAKEKAAVLVPIQIDAGKPADGKKTDAAVKTDAKDAPAQANADPSAQQTDAKPQGTAAAKPADQQADANARGEIRGHARHGAPAEAQRPAADPVSHAAPKPGADVGQTVVLNTPSHAGGATSAQAAAPAPPAAPSTPQQAVPLAGLAVAIAARALPGKHRFDIRLDPPELGRIEVRLDVDRDGRVTSHLVADRQDTLSLLQRDASGLQRALQDAGLKTSDNGLQFSLRDQSGDTPQNAGAAPTAQLVVEDETLAPLDPAHNGHAQLARLRGGLDIRV
jgi:flagellar hook-length control protein FliK